MSSNRFGLLLVVAPSMLARQNWLCVGRGPCSTLEGANSTRDLFWLISKRVVSILQHRLVACVSVCLCFQRGHRWLAVTTWRRARARAGLMRAVCCTCLSQTGSLNIARLESELSVSSVGPFKVGCPHSASGKLFDQPCGVQDWSKSLGRRRRPAAW